MATLLLFVIFMAFIGLGIPDSLIGSAWPAVYDEFNIPITFENFITVLTSVCTVLSSILSSKVVAKFGTGMVTAVSTMLTAVALLGFSLANNIVWLIILSIPLGVGAGAIDSGLNNYVALHYKATHMNFLHCFYGIGVASSPFLMSLMLSSGGGWRGGYRVVFYVQLGIMLLMFLALPLWKKVIFKNDDVFLQETEIIKNASLKEVVKNPLVRVAWLIFAGSCAVEFTCGSWCTTFFVEARGMSVDKAALALTFYYGGMALGRFTAGLLAIKLKPWQLIISGQCLTLVAITVMFFPVPDEVLIACLSLIAFGNGPVFPNMAHLTPIHFGKEASQTVMGTQMASCYIGITIMPPIFSFIANELGFQIFPYYIFAMFIVMAIGTLIFKLMLKKRKKF